MAMDSSKQSTSRQGRSYPSSVDDSLDKILQEIEEKKKSAAEKERTVALFKKRTFELKPRPSLIGRMFDKLNSSQDENTKNNELTPPNLNTTTSKITSPKNPDQFLKAPIPLPRTMQNQNFIASTPYGDKKNVFENNSTVFSPISKTHRYNNKEQKINNVRKSRLGEASGLQRTKSLSPRRSIFTKTTRSKSSTEIVVTENNLIEKVNESLNKKSPQKSNNESIKNNKNNTNLSLNSDKKNQNNKSIIIKDKNKSISAKSPKLAENSNNDLKKRGRPKKINSTQNVSIQTSLKRKSEESELNDSFTKKSKKNATIQTSVEKASSLKPNDSNKENINKLLSCLKDRSIDYILDENQRRNTGIKQIRVHSQKSICQKKARNLQSKRRASTGSDCLSDTDPSRSIDVDAANRKKPNLKRTKFIRRRPSDSEQSSSSELASAFSLYAGDYNKPNDGNNKSNLKKSASHSDYLFKSLPPPAESGSCAFTTVDNPDGIGDEKSTGKPWRCSTSLTKEEYLDVLKLSPKCHQTPTSPKSVSFVASQTRSKKDMSLSPTSANQLTPKSILKSPTPTSTTGVRKISSARKSIIFEDSPVESPKSVARGRPKKSLSLQRINRSPSKSPEKIDKSNSAEAEKRVVIINDVMVQPPTKIAKNSSKIRNQSRDREMSVENVRLETPPKKVRNDSKDRKANERDLPKASNSGIGQNTLSKAVKTSPGRPKRVRKQRQFISYDLDVLRLDINQILQQKEALTKPAKKRKPAKKSVKEQNSSNPSDSEQSTSKKSVKKSNLATKSKKLKTSLNTSRTKIVFDSSPKIKKRRGRPPKKALQVLQENETNNNNLNNMQMDSGLPSSNFSLSNNDHLNTNTNSTSFKSPIIDRKIVNNKEKSSPKIASPIAGPSTSDLIFKKPKTPISRSKIKENSSNISKNSNQSSSLLVKKSRGRPRKKPLLESVSDLQNSISSALERSRSSSLSPENHRLKSLINSAKENRVEKKSLINTIFKVSPHKTKALDKLDHSMTILVMNGEGTLHKDKKSISIKRTQFLHVPPKTKVSLEANDENLELFYFILSNP